MMGAVDTLIDLQSILAKSMSQRSLAIFGTDGDDESGDWD